MSGDCGAVEMSQRMWSRELGAISEPPGVLIDRGMLLLYHVSLFNLVSTPINPSGFE
jgi:hypothetical protein